MKQASANWYNKLKNSLQLRGFHESVADPCVFIKGSPISSHGECDTIVHDTRSAPAKHHGNCGCKQSIIERFRRESNDIIVLTYVDDCIILAQDKGTITKFISTLRLGPENFDFIDEGTLDKYLGLEVRRQSKGFPMSQPFLIERIITAANIDARMTNPKATPAVEPLLGRDENGPERKQGWNYRQLIGMLGYLQHTTRPDIAMATHQCARFSASNPKLLYERGVKRICKYLLNSMDKGIIFQPDLSRGLECHVDADFAGGWATCDQSKPESVLSRAGYMISCAGCPIQWCSKIESEIALSTTEAEYITMSMAMRDVLPFLNLMSEL